VAWLAASWALPLGVSAGYEDVVGAGAALVAVAVSLVVASLWPPLSVRGTPVVGLRLAVVGLVVTAYYGRCLLSGPATAAPPVSGSRIGHGTRPIPPPGGGTNPAGGSCSTRAHLLLRTGH
jgi:hypothetical protein